MAGKKKSGYDGKIAGLYDLEETIGHGHFAVVKLAKHVFTGVKVAVKVIDKQKLDDVSRAHLFQEVRCMKLVQHPNVVRLYEVIDTQTKLYLILELGDGDMYDYIMKHDAGLDEVLAKKYFRQIVEAILYCHRLHVVHRDLKPENVVFFNKLGIVKLTDFGFSNVFAPGKKLETSCGSLAYSAPEILLGDSYDPPAVDVWSLGVILFMLVAGRAPFQEANDSETLTMIMDCKYHIPVHVSEACKKLISKMLVREPSERIGLEAIEKDPWLASESRDADMMKVNLPLLSREHVSEEDHSHVVQKMVDGKICTREEIFQSLERDAYDHIAATYYLLMERRLRKLQQQEAVAAQTTLWKQPTPSSILAASKPHLEPLMLSPRSKRVALGPNSPTSLDYSDYDPPPQRGQSTNSEHSDSSSLIQSLVSPPGTHPSPVSSSPKMTFLSPEAIFAAVRKCSLILEEAQDADDFEMESFGLKPSRSLECLDERSSDLSSSAGQDLGVSSMSGSGGVDSVKPHRPLRSVCSSPQLLNQIHEEIEFENDYDFFSSKLMTSHGRPTQNRMASPEILRKYENRRRVRGKGQRVGSCSSSDASDTDDTDGRSRKEKLKNKLMNRRDSSGHSSDTEGPGGGSSAGGGSCVGNSGGESKPSYRNSSGGGGGGGSGGGGGNSKSGKSHSNQQPVHCSDMEGPSGGSSAGGVNCVGNGGGESKPSHRNSSGDGDGGISNNGKSHSNQPSVHYSDSNKSGEDCPSDLLQNLNCQVIHQCPGDNAEDDENLDHNNSHVGCEINTVGTIESNHLVEPQFLKEVCGEKENLGIAGEELVTEQRTMLSLNAATENGHAGTINNNNTSTVLNNNVNSRTSDLTTVVVSSTPTLCTAQYNGQYSFQGIHPLAQPVEFSEIPGYCDCLKDDQSKVSVCLGDCGLEAPSNQAHIKHNGVTSTFCNVGPSSPAVQVESKCCSVV